MQPDSLTVTAASERYHMIDCEPTFSSAPVEGINMFALPCHLKPAGRPNLCSNTATGRTSANFVRIFRGPFFASLQTRLTPPLWLRRAPFALPFQCCRVIIRSPLTHRFAARLANTVGISITPFELSLRATAHAFAVNSALCGAAALAGFAFVRGQTGDLSFFSRHLFDIR
jgi:hypothetical protein